MLAGDLADDTFNDYIIELQNLSDGMGPNADVAAIGPDHFSAYLTQLKAERKLGPHRLATVIRYVRALFNYAAKQGWIKTPDGQPRAVVFGADFVPPNTDPDAIAARKIRNGEDVDDDLIYTGEMIDWMIEHAPRQFKAMILVMINCGMGPSDLAKLKWSHIDLESGRLSMRRGKNGIRRECYLWKRTRKALRSLLTLKHTAVDIKANGSAALVFRTRRNKPFVWRERIMKDNRVIKVKRHNSISITVGRLVKKGKQAKVIPENAKLTAYNFRHAYFTYAENHPDLNAVHRTMGHALHGMGRRYKRKPFPQPRLKRVAMRVLRSVWPKPTKPARDPIPTMRLVGVEDEAVA
jgi:integrase